MSWLLIRFTATTLWLPLADAGELLVDVTTATTAPAGSGVWEPGALVPAPGWTGIRTAGDASSVSEAEFRPHRDVAVVKLGAGGGAAGLAGLGRVDHTFEPLQDVPRMTTQTMREDGHRLGLHLDNWDRLPAAQRHTSRNRASLNLGPEPRWFLFVDFDVIGAHAPDQVPDTDSARLLVNGRSRPPTVVRLRVPPGWAYIAPTENLLHDSWSLGQRTGSTHIPALGRFTPPTSSSTPPPTTVSARPGNDGS
jgi:hypothetical protein